MPASLPPPDPAESGKSASARLTLAREALAAYRTRCFWHLAPDFTATDETLPIIIAGLRSQDDRAAFPIAGRMAGLYATGQAA